MKAGIPGCRGRRPEFDPSRNEPGFPSSCGAVQFSSAAEVSGGVGARLEPWSAAGRRALVAAIVLTGATWAAAPAEKGGKAGGAAGGRGGGGNQRQPVEVVAPMRRDLSETLRVVGSLAPNETATIRPEMSGLIRSIHFDEGQPVKKGALLAKIDDSELQAQLAQSRSRHELARLNLERSENLRQTQSNTQADADRSRSEFAAAQADLDLLQVRLARTEVRAPFDGVAEARTLSPGDYVNTQAVITTVNDLSRLKVEFQVPERYLSKVRPGTKFSVSSTTLDLGAAAGGEVYYVNSVIDRRTRSSEVKGFLAAANPELKAGMFIVIEIVLEVRRNALTVPEGAVLVDQRGPQIILVGEEKGEKVARFVPVALGLRSRGLVEVRALKGELSENDAVVAAGVGSLALFTGARIEPRPLRAEFRIEN
jgi:membrane fusion protein (multidrug efflux system)